MFDIALGFHPCDLYDFSEDDYLRLEQLLQEGKLAAVGEIGLDYHWKDVEKERPEKRFCSTDTIS